MRAARLDRDWVLAERGLATVASLVLSLLYLVIYFFGRDALPEKWVTDSNKMLEFLVSGSTDLDDSFAATAKVFSLFGAAYVNVVTATVGVAYLALASSRVASLRASSAVRTTRLTCGPESPRGPQWNDKRR